MRGTTRVAAVIGWPVEHSRSPQMFEAAEIRALVNGATVKRKSASVEVRPTISLKAMILLARAYGLKEGS